MFSRTNSVVGQDLLAKLFGLWRVIYLVLAGLRKNVTIDLTLRESARARIRVIVRRILKKFGYPPDLQDAAVKLVLEQAETLSDEWAA